MQKQAENFRVQRWVVLVAVVLFIIKIIAWWLTRSVSILTDALESTVNVIAGVIGLYSLYVAAKPRDTDHPYGHGKAEFLSAAVEGTLIIVAGFIIVYESVQHLLHPRPLQQLDWGMVLVALAGGVNFVMGTIAIRRGRRNNSLALESSGRHLLTDTYSSIGILLGIALIYLTGYERLDPIVALLFSGFIVFTGYRILRRSVAGIMDEADRELLERMVRELNENRSPNWIDLHNLRVIKYGSVLHIDCHLTVPWYLNVLEAHHEIEALTARIRQSFGDNVEFFVHSDACMDYSCFICSKTDCLVRRHPFQQRIEWTLENILSDKRHRLGTANPALDKSA